jgi:hypothetical protein
MVGFHFYNGLDGIHMTSSMALSERLQQVTEALAIATTPEQVFDLILRPARPAVQMVGATGGAVLLAQAEGELERRAQQALYVENQPAFLAA